MKAVSRWHGPAWQDTERLMSYSGFAGSKEDVSSLYTFKLDTKASEKEKKKNKCSHVPLCIRIQPRQNLIKSSSIFHPAGKLKRSHVSMEIAPRLPLIPTSSPAVCSSHFPGNLHPSLEDSNVIWAVMHFYCSSCDALRYHWLSRCRMESFGGLWRASFTFIISHSHWHAGIVRTTLVHTMYGEREGTCPNRPHRWLSADRINIVKTLHYANCYACSLWQSW